jgi:hypothetical protein
MAEVMAFCMHMQMTLHEIPESTPDDSAHATPRNPAAPDLGRLSSSVRTALEGGVLCLRIVRVMLLLWWEIERLLLC